MRLDCGIMSNYEAPLPCHVLEELAFIDQSPKISSAKESDEGPLVKQARGQQANPQQGGAASKTFPRADVPVPACSPIGNPRDMRNEQRNKMTKWAML